MTRCSRGNGSSLGHQITQAKWTARAVGLMLLFGCGSPTVPVTDPRVCQPSNLGGGSCVEIRGQVVGAQGQPLAGISVGPRQSADGYRFNTVYESTDTAGRFVLRLEPIPGGGGGVSKDTFDIWVRAVVIPVLPQQVATVFDSALAHVVIAPLGTIPTSAEVQIRLPVGAQ